MLPSCAETASSSPWLSGDGIGEGMRGESRACSGGERVRMVTVASSVCRRGKYSLGGWCISSVETQQGLSPTGS